MQHFLTVHTSEICPALVVMVGARACAFPLNHVVETMRPLPIKPIAGTPGFVRGVSIIRGAPTPVIDLKALLDNSENSPSYGRFVILKLDDRRVSIGVDCVVGLMNLDSISERMEIAGMTFTPLAASHGIPACGYLVEKDGQSIAFSGDTEDCSAGSPRGRTQVTVAAASQVSRCR